MFEELRAEDEAGLRPKTNHGQARYEWGDVGGLHLCAPCRRGGHEQHFTGTCGNVRAFYKGFLPRSTKITAAIWQNYSGLEQKSTSL
jgi:hypothetical protein